MWCPHRLQKLAALAEPARTRMIECDFPEDWVHDTGRLVVVGSAAHPYPVRHLCLPSAHCRRLSLINAHSPELSTVQA